MPPQTRLLTPKQAAEVVPPITERMIREACIRGDLTAKKLGNSRTSRWMITEAALFEWAGLTAEVA